MVIRAAVGLFALLVCLASLHLCLFTSWYSGLRGAFTRVENQHIKDIKLAIEIAEAGPAPPEDGQTRSQEKRLALLFMLRTDLVEIDAWRRWLEPDGPRSDGQASVSIFFHLADGLEAAGSETVAALQALPGARVIPTVATGWCELMAAEVALFQSALQHDPSAEMLVLLPHDAVPLQPLSQVLKALLDSDVGVSRFCPAGVRDIEVPHDCAHGIEPHWARSLMLKHHQWIALSRTHAARLVHPKALAAANSIFESEYLGEPLCSDEVLPLLTLAFQEKDLHDEAKEQALSHFELYLAAVHGNFEQGLKDMGADAECILYAPWPGCGSSDIPSFKRAKSPILGGGMSPADRDALLYSLADRRVLFARKLGLSGGSVDKHMAMLEAAKAFDSRKRAPSRLLPLPSEDCCSTIVMVRWSLATVKASMPVPMLVSTSGGLAWIAGKLALAGGLAKNSFQRLILLYVMAHLAVFVFSVVAFSEYSFVEPFRKAGLLQRAEL